MKISLTSISIGQRVEAAKADTRPSNTDTSAVPSDVNPSPGDSTMAPIDTAALDSAGANVNQQTQQGNKATSDSARKSNNPANQNLQYDKQTVSAGDQAKTAPKAEELSATPPPKSKGFKESLIDAQMGSMMADKTGGNNGSIDSDFGHKNGDPSKNIKNQPDSTPIRRTQQSPYDNSGNKVPEPGTFPITSFEKSPNAPKYTAPEQDLGPQYKQKNISPPKLRFNSPKINTPRFN